MPTATMTGTEEVGYVDPGAPVDPALLAALASDLAPTGTTPLIQVHPDGTATPLSTRVGVLLELQGIKAALKTWFDKQPDQVIREASAYSARLTELWTELRLVESHDRQWTQLRTMQVQPLLDEIDRQYRFQTSRIAIMRQDIDLTR
jgi:hypothetical protein